MKNDPPLIISLALRPGIFGQTIYNAAFKALKLDYAYKPMLCEELSVAMHSIRKLHIHGASISMPFKVQAVKYMDELSPMAGAVGAVNTVISENDKLIGHNTDVTGAAHLLAGYQYLPWLVLGAGGMARAFLQAAKMLATPKIMLSARGNSGWDLAKQFGVEFIPWAEREAITGCAILNATNIGMAPYPDVTPIDVIQAKPQLVFDAVPKPVETQLITAARVVHIPVITGRELALAQAFQQFELYTGQPAPRDVMTKAAAAIA